MNIQWDPLIAAAVTGIIAVLLYAYNKWPRITGFFTGATLLFASVGFGLMTLAHHPLKSGPELMVVIPGFFGSLVAFVLIVVRGYHKKSLIKRRKGRDAVATQGQGAPRGGSSGKAPHHRAMAAWAAVTVFTFLFIVNLHGAAQVGQHGISQTVSGITQ